MKLYQGATYKIPIKLKIKNEDLNISDINKVDFAFGDDIVKSYPDSQDIKKENNKLIIYLSSEDTMKLPAEKLSKLKLQTRITFKDGMIKFAKDEPINVISTKFSTAGGVSNEL
jgi:hypothetical protein